MDTIGKPLITIATLCERMNLAAVPAAGDICRELNVDVVGLNDAAENMANTLLSDENISLQDVRNILSGVLAWGVALGFFYAKSEKPIITKVN